MKFFALLAAASALTVQQYDADEADEDYDNLELKDPLTADGIMAYCDYNVDGWLSWWEANKCMKKAIAAGKITPV